MRVAPYARVSTLNRQHTDVQARELREYAQRRGWKIVAEYRDEGISGTRERRPQLDRLWFGCRSAKWMWYSCTAMTASPAVFASELTLWRSSGLWASTSFRYTRAWTLRPRGQSPSTEPLGGRSSGCSTERTSWVRPTQSIT